MDVHCSTCGEPWDIYHLRHDAIHETHLSDTDKQGWFSLPLAQRLSPAYRAAFKEAGYVFGASVYFLLKCPCCPKGAKPNMDKVAMKAALCDVLGNDEDAIAAMMEDFGL